MQSNGAQAAEIGNRGASELHDQAAHDLPLPVVRLSCWQLACNRLWEL
jgi:hypothetical protein